MEKLAADLSATHDQMRLAYSRALRRTKQTITKDTVRLMRERTGFSDAARVRKRVLAFDTHRDKARELSGLKLFFGLNAVRLSDLKGRVSGRGGKHHDYRDPQTGRFATRPRRRKGSIPQFRPKGNAMPPVMSFGDDSHIGKTRRGRRSIFLRGRGARREAEADIYAPMIDAIEDEVLADLPAIFMHHYREDLTRRAKHGIHVDKKTRRRR